MTQDHPHRRPSLRLQGYNYTQAGFYFVTIVTQNRSHLFGEVSNCELHSNQFGRIVEWVRSDLPRHYPNLELGAFVVMPNHIHGILIIKDDTCRGGFVLARPSDTMSEDFDKDSHSETLKTHPYRKEDTFPYGKNQGLSEIVRALKTFSARRINKIRGIQGTPVWQRGYYDHIIRNQHDFELTWQYIESNPARWSDDEENPFCIPTGECLLPSW